MHESGKDNRKYSVGTYPLAIVGYVLFMLFVFFLYVFFQSRMILIFMCILTLMPFISVCSALFARSFVDLRITGNSGNTEVGAKNLWRIELRNRSIFTSLNCEVKGSIENTFMGLKMPLVVDMPMSAMGTEHFDMDMESEYCGRLRVSIESFTYRDLCGFISVTVQVNSDSTAFVMPLYTVTDRDDMDTFRTGVTESVNSVGKGNDFSEVTDMREYIPGDRLKDIHWKLSAKKQKLMVKEYTAVSQSEAVIFCDLGANALANNDIMGYAYGLSLAFIRELVPVRILIKTGRDMEFEEVTSATVPQLETAFKELMTSSIEGVTGGNLNLLFKVRPELRSVVLVHENGREIVGEVTERA
ncbi:MAG: DUF58 domain-containing protein [Lachnospiraceae bacterium]|nr:DUF58 domain-containing protein [Lachnospiraceae bacterium]